MEPIKGGQSAPETSPKLKMAALEIMEIMQKHDITGIVQLHEPGFNEFALKLDASWSCLSTNTKRELRITPPIEDPQNPEPAKRKIVDSVNMVANLRLHMTKLVMIFTQAEMAVRAHFGITAQKPQSGSNIIIPGKGLNGRKPGSK